MNKEIQTYRDEAAFLPAPPEEVKPTNLSLAKIGIRSWLLTDFNKFKKFVKKNWYSVWEAVEVAGIGTFLVSSLILIIDAFIVGDSVVIPWYFFAAGSVVSSISFAEYAFNRCVEEGRKVLSIEGKKKE